MNIYFCFGCKMKELKQNSSSVTNHAQIAGADVIDTSYEDIWLTATTFTPPMGN